MRLIALPLALLLALPALATPGLTKKEQAILDDSIKVLDVLTRAAEERIPQELLAQADCILIFPSIAKGAFEMGGKRGHGVASCRQQDGTMGTAAFYTVGGTSNGLQGGGQSADVVMLIMNAGGLDQLLSDRLAIGGEATAKAGPVGRTAEASTDAQRSAQILSWSRSRGGFLGEAFDGSVVKPNEDANERLYGGKTSGKEILVGGKLATPASTQPLVDSIRQHMPAAVTQEAAAAR